MARRAKAKPKPKGPKNTDGLTDKSQSARFIETARELGIAEDSDDFERAISKIIPSRAKPSRAGRS